MDALQYLPYLLAGGGVTAILVQIRLMMRESGERRLARHMFDQTRSTDGMDGYTRMIAARKTKSSSPPPARQQTNEPTQAEIES